MAPTGLLQQISSRRDPAQEPIPCPSRLCSFCSPQLHPLTAAPSCPGSGSTKRTSHARPAHVARRDLPLEVGRAWVALPRGADVAACAPKVRAGNGTAFNGQSARPIGQARRPHSPALALAGPPLPHGRQASPSPPVVNFRQAYAQPALLRMPSHPWLPYMVRSENASRIADVRCGADQGSSLLRYRPSSQHSSPRTRCSCRPVPLGPIRALSHLARQAPQLRRPEMSTLPPYDCPADAFPQTNQSIP